jgi:hypothetical protein
MKRINKSELFFSYKCLFAKAKKQHWEQWYIIKVLAVCLQTKGTITNGFSFSRWSVSAKREYHIWRHCFILFASSRWNAEQLKNVRFQSLLNTNTKMIAAKTKYKKMYSSEQQLKFKWKVRKILAVDLTSKLYKGVEHWDKNELWTSAKIIVAVNKMALRTGLGASEVPNPIWQKPPVLSSGFVMSWHI